MDARLEVQETGDFELDGVTFPAAEVKIEFLNPADGEGAMFPTGNVVDTLEVPGDRIQVPRHQFPVRGVDLFAAVHHERQAIGVFQFDPAPHAAGLGVSGRRVGLDLDRVVQQRQPDLVRAHHAFGMEAVEDEFDQRAPECAAPLRLRPPTRSRA